MKFHAKMTISDDAIMFAVMNGDETTLKRIFPRLFAVWSARRAEEKIVTEISIS